MVPFHSIRPDVLAERTVAIVWLMRLKYGNPPLTAAVIYEPQNYYAADVICSEECSWQQDELCHHEFTQALPTTNGQYASEWRASLMIFASVMNP
jgi:hypothetical protein